MKTFIVHLVILLAVLPIYSYTQHCPQNYESQNFSRDIIKEYNEEIISITACRQVKDSKVIQRVYFNLKNNTSEDLIVWLRFILYCKDGHQEVMGKDSMFKTLSAWQEISGTGDNFDADLFIEISNDVSPEEDKIEEMNVEIFSIYKVIDGKDILIVSSTQKNLIKPVPNPSDSASLSPSLPKDSLLPAAPAKTAALEVKKTPKDSAAATPEFLLSKKEQRKLEKEKKKKEKEEEKKPPAAIADTVIIKSPPPDSVLAPVDTSAEPIVQEPKDTVATIDKDAPTSEDIDWAKAQVIEKVKQLEINFTVLANKKTPLDRWQNTLNNTVALFIDEDQLIEVSSIFRKALSQYKIRDYCQRLKFQMSYDSAHIQNANVYFVSYFQKNNEGQWEAVVAYIQRFTGFIENRPVYSDITEKKAKVILRQKPKMEEGETRKNWELMLGDIRVLSTKANDSKK